LGGEDGGRGLTWLNDVFVFLGKIWDVLVNTRFGEEGGMWNYSRMAQI